MKISSVLQSLKQIMITMGSKELNKEGQQRPEVRHKRKENPEAALFSISTSALHWIHFPMSTLTPVSPASGGEALLPCFSLTLAPRCSSSCLVRVVSFLHLSFQEGRPESTWSEPCVLLRDRGWNTCQTAGRPTQMQAAGWRG